jgi:thioredoxin-like negative regulator of GroEL
VETFGPDMFEGTHLRRAGTWVVDFSADWCPFCQEFLPKFASLPRPSGVQLAIGDLTDYHSPLWDRFSLEVTPTVIVFREGAPVFRRDGRRGEGLDEDDLKSVSDALQDPRGGRDLSPDPGS